ncbi:hypothetical protein VCHC19A1_3053, partial [Vibrio cholerae HC-19A1]
MTAISNCPC